MRVVAETGSGRLGSQQAIIDGIKRGLADLKAGRLLPHEAAMAEVMDEIASAADLGAR